MRATSHSGGSRGSLESCRAVALIDNTSRKVKVEGEIIKWKWAFIIWNWRVEVEVLRVIKTTDIVSEVNWVDAVRAKEAIGW